MFKSKVVIVTGASSGIGAVVAEMFAKEGANLAIVGRREDKLFEVKVKCQKYGGQALVIKADVSKDEDASTIVKRTIETYGKLDILVNNAGVAKEVKVDDDNALEVFDLVVSTNLRSAILLTGLAIPYLKESKGSVVNVSSIAGITVPSGWPGLTMYAVSKAGLDHYTRGAALELSRFGVRVNSVNPGPVITDMLGDERLAIIGELQKITPLGRFSDADEIGDMILYLSSDKARGITGSSFVVDNGTLLK